VFVSKFYEIFLTKKTKKVDENFDQYFVRFFSGLTGQSRNPNNRRRHGVDRTPPCNFGHFSIIAQIRLSC